LLLQSLDVLNQLEALLGEQLGWARGKEVERIDGSVSARERDIKINRFNKAGSTSKVGMGCGVGWGARGGVCGVVWCLQMGADMQVFFIKYHAYIQQTSCLAYIAP
jgi:hypothetical protein